MSIHTCIAVDLHCDKCGARYGGWQEDFDIINDAVVDMIAQAQNDDWHITAGAGGHLCQDCRRDIECVGGPPEDCGGPLERGSDDEMRCDAHADAFESRKDKANEL